MIAAIYVVITYVGAAFSFGEVQVRISEALTILPVFTPAAVPGLFVGCLIGNILGGAILPGYHLRKSCHFDRRFLYMEASQPEPHPRTTSTNHCKYYCCSIRSALWLRCNFTNPVHDADGRYRRSDFLWYTRTDPCICAGQIQTHRISKCINKIECALAHSRAERVAERL